MYVSTEGGFSVSHMKVHTYSLYYSSWLATFTDDHILFLIASMANLDWYHRLIIIIIILSYKYTLISKVDYGFKSQ